MSDLILHPSEADKKKWKILAHLTEEDRNDVLALPLPQRNRRISSIANYELPRARKKAGIK